MASSWSGPSRVGFFGGLVVRVVIWKVSQGAGGACWGFIGGWRLGFFLGHMDLVRSWILGVGHDFRQLGLLVVIYVPISPGFFVMGTWDPGGDRALIVFEQFFGRHPVLTDSRSECRICINEFADRATETSLEGSPSSP